MNSEPCTYVFMLYVASGQNEGSSSSTRAHQWIAAEGECEFYFSPSSGGPVGGCEISHMIKHGKEPCS